jgi:lipid II:glycine glycyltransferase (peptidoglycan interpeptide bridge formation enzyme)
MRFANNSEIAEWNSRILNNPDLGNMLQGAEFAEQKQTDGWMPRYVVADELAITVLERTVFGLGKLWYVPKGPGVTSPATLGAKLDDLHTFARNNGVFAVKIEPEITKSSESMAAIKKLGLVPVAPIQPNFSTITVDISPDLDTVLSHLNQKGRHAIRRAERDGVTVQRVEASEENCQTFYNLLTETAAGSFSIRPYAYTKAFWQRYVEAGLGQLFFAYVEGNVVAAAFAVVYGTKSTYKDGASVRERTAYGASHLLQWHVMTWAKEKGSLIHDLCGAPPSDQINNPDHKHYGIGRFKTSFNKEVTDYVGTFDLVVRPAQYKVWRKIGERLTVRLYWQRHHESWY